MAERIATIAVFILYVYLSVGLLFAIPFAWRGLQKVDCQATGAGFGFRCLILPGTIAFWPLLLRRWFAPPVNHLNRRIHTDDSIFADLASARFPCATFLAANYFYRRIGSTPSFSIAKACFPMSNQYTAISWNTQKRWYDIVLIAGIVLYTAMSIALSSLLHPTATAETLIIRAAGSCAFLLLTVVLCIGPRCFLRRLKSILQIPLLNSEKLRSFMAPCGKIRIRF